jgi:iron(III) transport system permease protein
MLPLASLLLEGIAPNGQFSTAALSRVLTSPTTWMATRHSLVTALGGTLVAVVIGSVVALIVALTDIRARNAFVFCFVLPLMIAPQVVALAWLQLFGPSSTVLKMFGLAPGMGSRNPLYSAEGIVALLGIQYAPLVFLTLRAGLRTLPQELVEARLAAGASPFKILRTIVLPLMTPPLVAGIALCFVSVLVTSAFRRSWGFRATTSFYRRSSTSGSPASAQACCRRLRFFVLIGTCGGRYICRT